MYLSQSLKINLFTFSLPEHSVDSLKNLAAYQSAPLFSGKTFSVIASAKIRTFSQLPNLFQPFFHLFLPQIVKELKTNIIHIKVFLNKIQKNPKYPKKPPSINRRPLYQNFTYIEKLQWQCTRRLLSIE